MWSQFYRKIYFPFCLTLETDRLSLRSLLPVLLQDMCHHYRANCNETNSKQLWTFIDNVATKYWCPIVDSNSNWTAKNFKFRYFKTIKYLRTAKLLDLCIKYYRTSLWRTRFFLNYIFQLSEVFNLNFWSLLHILT